MRAIGIDAYGGPEQLHVLDVPEPKAGEGEVLIAVRAAGVAYSDVKMRRGDFGKDAPMPLRLGLEVSGTIRAVGAGVTNFAPGDDVYAYLSHPGGYAEAVVEKAALVGRKPASIDYTLAAALPLAAITADTAVESLGFSPGATIFIAGGAGGVGSYAVQLAVRAGARVIASGAAKDEAFVRGLGADGYVDYTDRAAGTKIRGLEGAIDAVGAESAALTIQTVRPGGKLVDLGWSGDLAGDPSVQIVRFSAEPSGARLEKLAKIVDAGALKVTVERTYPLAEARTAHELVEARRVRGKLVLTV